MEPQNAPSKRQKTVYKADSPFSSPTWPHIEAAEQDVILQLLCTLLAPIGHHRSTHITPSKGKRGKKRKRKDNATLDSSAVQNPQVLSPPPPLVQTHITVGLNSTSRHLESLLPFKCPKGPNATASSGPGPNSSLVAIFLTNANSNYLPYSPLPTLTALASAARPSSPAIRLIQLRSNAEAKICEALGLPRAGIVGVFEDAPGARPLVERVREIEAVDVPWTREVSAGQWLGTNISVEGRK